MGGIPVLRGGAPLEVSDFDLAWLERGDEVRKPLGYAAKVAFEDVAPVGTLRRTEDCGISRGCLLPVEWRKINDYGITIDYRTYGCMDLGPLPASAVWGRRQGQPLGGPSRPLRPLPRLGTRHPGWRMDHGSVDPAGHGLGPFADFTWRHAGSLLAARGADTTDEGATAVVVEDLLTRAGTGPDRRIAARTRAASAVPGRPVARVSPQTTEEKEPDEDEVVGKVIPFGVFDAFTDGSR
ncbi:hypothetical protein [Streptomyces albipurpureus]|uniref:Uncharacterized protein n=1 Tax=Streptomyces albipurpureus TaxID=2897419 RepID=A0ABT0UX78_9ACTN|nr:hypothetical protein [Streptomyces sp. CWNU-1]MCM2393172.1 hypothetical protein [Streptomyces sp. CWNU-1]